MFSTTREANEPLGGTLAPWVAIASLWLGAVFLGRTETWHTAGLLTPGALSSVDEPLSFLSLSLSCLLGSQGKRSGHPIDGPLT